MRGCSAQKKLNRWYCSSVTEYGLCETRHRCEKLERIIWGFMRSFLGLGNILGCFLESVCDGCIGQCLLTALCNGQSGLNK
jgi:hypothetical protein